MSPTSLILLVIGIFVFIYFNFPSKGGSFLDRFRASENKFHHSKLVSVLLGLPEQALDELLNLYKKEFGSGAARYAKRTYKKWKTGKVQPTARTYERFLVHLPKVMTYDLKCEVLRHFIEEYANREHYKLDVFTDDWEEKLTPIVRQIVDKAYTAQLPAEVERKLHWLGDGDMQAAQKILRASQAEEGKIMIATLSEEIENIEKLLAAAHLKPKVSHTLRFPYGDVEINIKRR